MRLNTEGTKGCVCLPLIPVNRLESANEGLLVEKGKNDKLNGS